MRTYKSSYGLICMFNLIVGPGVLTMPYAFQQTGWLLSSLVVSIMAFLSYITFTFILEAITITNALFRLRDLRSLKCVTSSSITTAKTTQYEDRVHSYTLYQDEQSSTASTESFDPDNEPIIDETTWYPASSCLINQTADPELLSLDRRFEMGELVNELLSPNEKVVFVVFYSCYLFGDLSICYKTIGDSFVNFTCSNIANNTTNSSDLCWESYPHTRNKMYLIYVFLCMLTMGIFTVNKFQKIKDLQKIGFVVRVTAVVIMVILATVRLISPTQAHGNMPANSFFSIPQLIGASMYAFMCQHSVPSAIAPIKDKKGIYLKVTANFIFVYILYMVLCFTGVFAFPNVAKLYSTNFTPTQDTAFFYKLVDPILVLFPVVTTVISIPVITALLRHNLFAIFKQYYSNAHWTWIRVFIPLCALFTPALLAAFVTGLEEWVFIVAVYIGTAIQYVTPALLILAGRAKIPPEVVGVQNNYCSPLKSRYWPIGILMLSVACVVAFTNYLLLKN